MAIENGTFTNRLDVDRFFAVWARIEGQRAGVQIIYKGKRLKQAAEAGDKAMHEKYEKPEKVIRDRAVMV